MIVIRSKWIYIYKAQQEQLECIKYLLSVCCYPLPNLLLLVGFRHTSRGRNGKHTLLAYSQILQYSLLTKCAYLLYLENNPVLITLWAFGKNHYHEHKPLSYLKTACCGAEIMDLELTTCVWILALSSPAMELIQAPQPT